LPKSGNIFSLDEGKNEDSQIEITILSFLVRPVKIRSKLLLIYGIMISSLLIVGAFCIWTIVSWRRAATELSEMHEQSLRAERLRAETHRQIYNALDYLNGEEDARQDFLKIQEITPNLLEVLRSRALTTEEKDRIEGLDETHYELVWIMNKYFERGEELITDQKLPTARARLREIGDEVTDDVASLNQYYRLQENKRMAAAADAGIFAAYVIGIIIVIAVIQFVALMFLLQRWLVRPIMMLNDTTRTISEGNLDTRIDLASKDEWGQLSTAIEKMTSSLKISQQRLRTQERFATLGEIATYSAHNIRNPLAGIRATTQVMLDELAEIDAETRQSLKDIMNTIDRIDICLKRLHEVARPLEIEYCPTDINPLVNEALTLAGRSFEEKHIKLDWRLAPNLPPAIIDPVLVEQALAAIAANAYEAISEKGTISIETGLRKDMESISISISDDGRGIPDQIKGKLFRAFMTGKEGGIGLGLAQAKKIVDMHGGQINLESSPGEGTTVSISLPINSEKDPPGSR
jgi:signal transduction histidine kinase